MVRIGIDAMGGDFAPEVAVEGAVMALKKIGKQSRVVLFGDEKRIRELLKKHNCSADNFDIVGTTEVIEMGDHPAKAFISKKDSSMTVGFRHLVEGKIDGFASAGSTGAMMALADGKYTVSWAFNYTPNVDAWRLGMESSLLQYSANGGSWDDVVTAYVNGWATQYAAQ